MWLGEILSVMSRSRRHHRLGSLCVAQLAGQPTAKHGGVQTLKRVSLKKMGVPWSTKKMIWSSMFDLWSMETNWSEKNWKLHIYDHRIIDHHSSHSTARKTMGNFDPIDIPTSHLLTIKLRDPFEKNLSLKCWMFPEDLPAMAMIYAPWAMIYASTPSADLSRNNGVMVVLYLSTVKSGDFFF